MRSFVSRPRRGRPPNSRYCRADTLETAVAAYSNVTTYTDPGADHFFRGREPALVDAVAPFVNRSLLAATAAATAAASAAPPPPPEAAAAASPPAELLEYRIRTQKGALVRAGVELDTALVAEVPCGEVVRVRSRVMAKTGAWRCEIDAPRGWLSEKTLTRLKNKEKGKPPKEEHAGPYFEELPLRFH